MLKLSLPTFFWVFVNLIILYLFLRWILFKPVTRMMDARANGIKADLENAAKIKSEAEQIKQQYEEKLLAAKEEARQILEAARERGEKEAESIIRAAQQQADEYMEKARKRIELEREQIMQGIKNQVVTLALAAASKVVEANMDNNTNHVLVERFLDEEGAAR